MKITIDITKQDIESTKKLLEIGYSILAISLQIKVIEEIKKL